VRNLLSPLQEKHLFDFLETDPILAFDYDGTLAPIVKNAGQAQLRPTTKRLLKSLCEFYICALLTGRARNDVLIHLEGIPFAQVLGNHGAEGEIPSPENELMMKETEEWRMQLEAHLGSLQGVQIEDKKLSLSVHYRKARRKSFTIARIEETLKRLKGCRIIGGKQVVNVLPKELGGKGQALVQLKKSYGRATAFFIGDDLNDEEVFTLPESEQIFKARVGRNHESRAEYFIEHQQDMDELLKLILKYARLKRETALEPVSVVQSRSRRALSHSSAPRARAISE
jgi:trehalose 6-phosphate phosphatase